MSEAKAACNTRTLLLRWHSGDRGALESLLAQHLEWLSDYVHSRLGARLREKEETGDLVQETALEVLQYIPRFVLSDSDQFRALLARLVENVLRDRVRWYRAHRRDVNREQPVEADAILDLDTPFCSADRRKKPIPDVMAYGEWGVIGANQRGSPFGKSGKAAQWPR